MRRLLAMAAVGLAACTPTAANDTFTISDPPDGLTLTAIENYELSEQALESVGGATFSAEQVRLHQATTGNSLALGGGTRQVFGSDQGSAATWSDIVALHEDRAGVVLTTWPATGDDGVELLGTVRSPVSSVQFTDRSGALITAAASNPDTDAPHFIVWQQNGSWVALYSDTIPVSGLISIASSVEPAMLENLQDELGG